MNRKWMLLSTCGNGAIRRWSGRRETVTSNFDWLSRVRRRILSGSSGFLQRKPGITAITFFSPLNPYRIPGTVSQTGHPNVSLLAMRCAELKKAIEKQLPPLFECVEEDGRLTIVTPMEYPDGDLIELYLVEEPEGLVLTDLAETLAILASYNLDVKRSPKRFKVFQTVLKAQDVHYFEGSLRIPIISLEDVVPALLRLAQAVLRVSDLLFTLRFGAGTTFKDEVEEFLTEHQVRYETDYRVTGRSGQQYTIDFYIERRKPFLIQALSSGSSSYAEILVSKTIRMWFDVTRVDGRYQYVSLLDDMIEVWKSSQFEILGDLSTVITWSERERLLALVQAE